MSANFFLNDAIIQNSKGIRVHTAEVNGNLKLSGSGTGLTVDAGTTLDVNGPMNVSGDLNARKLTFNPLPVLYTQATDGNTAVNISGAEESFDINTVALTTASGDFQAFNVTHSGVGANDMVLLTQISYSGVYNVNGALSAHVAGVTAGIITVGIKNWGSGSANGAIKLRFKLIHNTTVG